MYYTRNNQYEDLNTFGVNRDLHIRRSLLADKMANKDMQLYLKEAHKNEEIKKAFGGKVVATNKYSSPKLPPA